MSSVEKIKINGARVLVKETKLTDETKSGFIVQGRSKQATHQGKVLVVGDGAMLEDGTKVPVGVKPGDYVVYSAFSGAPIKLKPEDDEEYMILNERDILCIIGE